MALNEVVELRRRAGWDPTAHDLVWTTSTRSTVVYEAVLLLWLLRLLWFVRLL